VADSGGFRNQPGLDWRYKGAATVVSGGAFAALLGGLVGWVGGEVPTGLRAAMGTLGAIVLVAAAVFPRLPVPQRDVETERSLLSRGPIAWAAVNGGLLGIAITSRIGFWLWYVVPLASFLLGSWWAGALIYGWYGFSRLAAIVVLAALVRRSSARWADRLTGVRSRRAAHLACRVALIPVAMCYLAAFGS